VIDKIDVTFNNTKLETHRIAVFCRQLIIVQNRGVFRKTYIVLINYMPKVRVLYLIYTVWLLYIFIIAGSALYPISCAAQHNIETIL